MKIIWKLIGYFIWLSFTISFLSILLASWGVVIESSSLVMFWYIALVGAVLTMTASLFAGVLYLVSKVMELYQGEIKPNVKYQFDNISNNQQQAVKRVV